MIRCDAERESLDVRVIQRDIFSTLDDLRQDYRLILLSEVVSDFRTTKHLRGLFELAAHVPGSRWALGVQRVSGARRLHTRQRRPRPRAANVHEHLHLGRDVAAAAQLPLTLVSDDSVYEYEKAHLPEGAWPPTSWYAEWVSGQDVFDVAREECPIEMRWLVYQKRAVASSTTRLVNVSLEGLG